jgi:microtubule-associated serine/threonine kinase
MEERLEQFVDTNRNLELLELESDGIARFVHHQVVEAAKDCLEKSHDKTLTAQYFYEMSERLELLLKEVAVYTCLVT